MESLAIGDEIITDGSEICSKATNKFKDWFRRSREEKERDCMLSRLMGTSDRKEWVPFMNGLKIPEATSEVIIKGMEKKELCQEGRLEGLEIAKYIPTWEEFRKLIRSLNSRSAGGISGLTYHMVKLWNEKIKKGYTYAYVRNGNLRRNAKDGRIGTLLQYLNVRTLHLMI